MRLAPPERPAWTPQVHVVVAAVPAGPEGNARRTQDVAPGMSEATDSRRVALLVGLLFGLAGLGSSSAAIALPVLAEDLGVSTGVSAWAVSLYALMLAVATAVYGRVSDLVGIRAPLSSASP